MWDRITSRVVLPWPGCFTNGQPPRMVLPLAWIHFENWTFWTLDLLNIGPFEYWIFWKLDLLKIGSFENWTFWKLDHLKIGSFENWTVWKFDLFKFGSFENWSFCSHFGDNTIATLQELSLHTINRFYTRETNTKYFVELCK